MKNFHNFEHLICEVLQLVEHGVPCLLAWEGVELLGLKHLIFGYKNIVPVLTFLCLCGSLVAMAMMVRFTRYTTAAITTKKKDEPKEAIPSLDHFPLSLKEDWLEIVVWMYKAYLYSLMRTLWVSLR